MLKIFRSFYTGNSASKYVLIFREDKTSKLAEALSQRIQQDLRKSHLRVAESNQIIHSPQVPYIVVIKSQTLDDGILELRHYSTKVREQVHVSDLVDKLQQWAGTMTLRGT